MIERKVKAVRALERGLQVLSEIERTNGANLHELHLALGLPKATLLRMVVTLGKHGHIWQRIADGTFLPSCNRDRRLNKPLSGEEIAECASPHLARLANEIAWPAVLSVPRGDHMEIAETNAPMLRLDAITIGPIGNRLSFLHTATGRAFLAFCSDETREAIVQRLRPAQDDGSGERLIGEMLQAIRDRGYALREPFHPWADRDWQAARQDGRRSMAVPVRYGGLAVASINITWLQRRSETATVVQRHLTALRKAAEAVSADLAARPSGL